MSNGEAVKKSQQETKPKELLLLLIGYFVPLPPSVEQNKEKEGVV